MYSMDISINQSAFPDSDTQPNKRRRKKSMVWEHFTIETVKPDCVRACCNQCKKSFAYISGSKLAGTSHLKRHIALGICPVSRNNQDKDQIGPCETMRNNISTNGTSIPRKRVRAANGAASTYFDSEICSNNLARMIIQHDYPLEMVEQTGFLDFARSLQPQFNITSVGTVQEKIMDIYKREKLKLVSLLSEIPGRLNLTVELFTSNQSLVYVVLTGHFADRDWKLQRRILNVSVVESPDSDTAFNHVIAACLTDWRIEGKLFTITLDRSCSNENARENLRNLLPVKNSHVLKSQLLINSCYARMLRTLAQDAMGSMWETVDKVRQSVKYVKTCDIHEEKFVKLKQQLQVPSAKNLMMDDLTKWNTTYQMLIAACELKEVFYCLDTCDPDYKLTLPVQEWGRVETLCAYLKILYQAASILTSPLCPTTNLFFDELRILHVELVKGAGSQDVFVSSLTTPLLEKLTKYWEDCNLVLAIAAVMDPRFKMNFVRFSFIHIYGEDADAWIRAVDQGLHELYLDYAMPVLPGPTIDEGHEHMVKMEVPQEDGLYSDHDGFLDFDVDISDIMGESHVRSELDQYLEESILPRVQDFDVLGWWKANRLRYPTLSRLAFDVLSIPLSTVPPESVFDTREREMDSRMSSLRPAMLQALVCNKDWLRYESAESPFKTPSENHAAIVKTEF